MQRHRGRPHLPPGRGPTAAALELEVWRCTCKGGGGVAQLAVAGGMLSMHLRGAWRGGGGRCARTLMRLAKMRTRGSCRAPSCAALTPCRCLSSLASFLCSAHTCTTCMHVPAVRLAGAGPGTCGPAGLAGALRACLEVLGVHNLCVRVVDA